MASYKSPLADPSAVQKIADDLNHLAVQSVDIEEGVDKAKRDAIEVAQKYQSDFDIMSRIPVFFEQFADNLRNINNTARDVAVKISAIYEEFVMILGIIETIKTKEELQQLVQVLKDALKANNPVDETPLDGFQGVTNAFKYIWSLKVDLTTYIIDVLEKATDIPKTIEELTAELKPAMVGGSNVQKALKDYAGHIHN